MDQRIIQTLNPAGGLSQSDCSSAAASWRPVALPNPPLPRARAPPARIRSERDRLCRCGRRGDFAVDAGDEGAGHVAHDDGVGEAEAFFVGFEQDVQESGWRWLDRGFELELDGRFAFGRGSSCGAPVEHARSCRTPSARLTSAKYAARRNRDEAPPCGCLIAVPARRLTDDDRSMSPHGQQRTARSRRLSRRAGR